MSNKVKMTAEEQVIANEVLCSDTDWQTITEKDIQDFSLAEDPYKLPVEAEKERKEKRFAFRWILNDIGRLKEIMNLVVPMKWWPCNSTNTPFLEKQCSHVDGAVHCQDQILVFKPYWMLVKYLEIINRSQEGKMKDLEDKKNQVEDGSEWIVGKQSKVQKSDVVMATAEDNN